MKTKNETNYKSNKNKQNNLFFVCVLTSNFLFTTNIEIYNQSKCRQNKNFEEEMDLEIKRGKKTNKQ